jgi:ATP-dependent helicase/nuclease subunit B
MAWALTEGSQKSGFRPRWAELKFGLGDGLPPLEIAFEEGGGLTLRGTIDRVDIALDSGLRFLRVVDYKTGKTSLNASDIDAGVQLQLLLYMKAALTLLSGTEPAGAFYQLMDDPLVKADTTQEAQKKARDKLRLDGIILKDKRVVQLMDGGEPPTTLVNLISRDGSLKEKDRLLSREELERLICLAEDRAREAARQIFSSLISRKPLFRASGRAECQWCDYAGVCRMDKISREKSVRRANKTGFKQLIEQNQYSGGDLAAGKRRDAML